MEDRIDSATRTVEAGARERGERLESLVSGALVGRARLQGFAAGLVSIGAVAATLGGALTLAAGGG
jgi:hypothetical protein